MALDAPSPRHRNIIVCGRRQGEAASPRQVAVKLKLLPLEIADANWVTLDPSMGAQPAWAIAISANSARRFSRAAIAGLGSNPAIVKISFQR